MHLSTYIGASSIVGKQGQVHTRITKVPKDLPITVSPPIRSSCHRSIRHGEVWCQRPDAMRRLASYRMFVLARSELRP